MEDQVQMRVVRDDVDDGQRGDLLEDYRREPSRRPCSVATVPVRLVKRHGGFLARKVAETRKTDHIADVRDRVEPASGTLPGGRQPWPASTALTAPRPSGRPEPEHSLRDDGHGWVGIFWTPVTVHRTIAARSGCSLASTDPQPRVCATRKRILA